MYVSNGWPYSSSTKQRLPLVQIPLTPQGPPHCSPGPFAHSGQQEHGKCCGQLFGSQGGQKEANPRVAKSATINSATSAVSSVCNRNHFIIFC